MRLKTIFCLAFCAVSCTSTFEKSNGPHSTYINDTKVECPAPGTWIDCMPALDEEVKFYCRSDVRKWVMKNCKDVHYTD